MMITLKKTYEITVTIQEGNGEFWDNLREKAGCDEVVEEVKRSLADHGFVVGPGCQVRLTKFEVRHPQG